MSTAAAGRLEALRINGETEEVRLAMAWNGGVSLAVWMGGVAVELDAARRAHLGKGGSDDGRSIYRALCRAFNRILVLDILTGASAGGINGALLGAVITHRRRLDANYLRNRWIALGNFSDLLRPTNMKKPPSLMDGDYFAGEVLSTFRACLGAGPEAAAGELELAPDDYLPDEVLLDVQSTNVFGLQRAIPDHWGEYFYAREYRAPIRFRRPEDYTAEALATAARASASFPAAFEPAKIDGDAARLAGYEGQIRWGIDGGLLENAPIEAAIDMIPKRRADRRVRRFVVYVNADPPGKAAVVDQPPSPDLQQVLGHVVNLPRDGRVIDELVAIENAFRRGQTAADAVLPLAQLPYEALRDTAGALLDAYRRRRALGSLEEVTAQPGQPPRPGLARVIFDRLVDVDQLSLPWLPPAGSVQVSLDDWRWGIRAAQRVLFLELDLLRLAGSPDTPSREPRPDRRGDRETRRSRDHAARQGLDPRGHGGAPRRRGRRPSGAPRGAGRTVRRVPPRDLGSAPDRDERVPRRDRSRADRRHPARRDATDRHGPRHVLRLAGARDRGDPARVRRRPRRRQRPDTSLRPADAGCPLPRDDRGAVPRSRARLARRQAHAVSTSDTSRRSTEPRGARTTSCGAA